MDSLTIIFVGLITHLITPSGIGRAVLISAPLHSPRIVVAAEDVIDVSLTEEQTTPGDRSFSISGEHIRFHGLSHEVPLRDPSYFAHVPQLTRISDGTRLLPEIERAESHPAVAAYVDVTGGRFAVEELEQLEVRFERSRWLGPKCMARDVVFTANVTGNSVELQTDSGRFLRLRAGATIRIENEPPDSTGDSHLFMYSQILTDATHVVEPTPTGRGCNSTLPERRPAQSTDSTYAAWRHRMRPNPITLGCSNSNWP